jgi:hypothetical protein
MTWCFQVLDPIHPYISKFPLSWTPNVSTVVLKWVLKLFTTQIWVSVDLVLKFDYECGGPCPLVRRIYFTWCQWRIEKFGRVAWSLQQSTRPNGDMIGWLRLPKVNHSHPSVAYLTQLNILRKSILAQTLSTAYKLISQLPAQIGFPPFPVLAYTNKIHTSVVKRQQQKNRQARITRHEKTLTCIEKLLQKQYSNRLLQTSCSQKNTCFGE